MPNLLESQIRRFTDGSLEFQSPRELRCLLAAKSANIPVSSLLCVFDFSSSYASLVVEEFFSKILDST